MQNWFECKIKYEKTVEEGKIATVSESYLVDALSFNEAENRIIEEMKPFISGEFNISSVRRVRIQEMIQNQNGDKWYRCKVNFISLDEESAVEKILSVAMYVQADSFINAHHNLVERLKNSLSDYVIASITETAIMDVYNYVPENQNPASETVN